MERKAQGATEYLVLLAVVLIVALVSVALLGFFPGMASDAQVTQSKAYWASASPVSITEWAVSVSNANLNATENAPYFRIRNSGAYPIRITKILSAKFSPSIFYGGHAGCTPPARGNYNISDYFYMAPGEEKYFGYSQAAYSLGTDCDYSTPVPTSSTDLYCERGKPGFFKLSDFGFEYIEYIEGQQITKRQVGKPLLIKCS